eukprot:scaffold52733_cov22-Tisochrysis_lutea.AAC.1
MNGAGLGKDSSSGAQLKHGTGDWRTAAQRHSTNRGTGAWQTAAKGHNTNSGTGVWRTAAAGHTLNMAPDEDAYFSGDNNGNMVLTHRDHDDHRHSSLAPRHGR